MCVFSMSLFCGMYRSSAFMKIKSLFGDFLFVCFFCFSFNWKHRIYLKTRAWGFCLFCIVLSTQSTKLGSGSLSFILSALKISVSTHPDPWLCSRGIIHLSLVLHVKWSLIPVWWECQRQLRQDSVLSYPFSQLWAKAEVQLWVTFSRSWHPMPHQTFFQQHSDPTYTLQA